MIIFAGDIFLTTFLLATAFHSSERAHMTEFLFQLQ